MVKNFGQIFFNSNLNVLVKFYEKWITGSKKNLNVILAYFGLLFTFAMARPSQNCYYSQTNYSEKIFCIKVFSVYEN